MGIFDSLVRHKQDEQHNIEMRDHVTHQVRKEDIVQHQLLEEQVRYEHLQAHAMDEAEVGYESLQRTASHAAPLTLAEQKRKLAPPIDETGMDSKKRQKVRNRTLQNLKEGRELVGEMGTAQTIPLMRSLKKNAKKAAKHTSKDKKTIEDFLRLEIPRDIFDVSLTEKHSHFDVKKALIISAEFDKIRQYKEKHGDVYARLDLETYSKLEYMLDLKEAFDKTLKVVLAANGLSETGEPLTEEQDKIAEARDNYYPYRDALIEMYDKKDDLLPIKISEIKEQRKKAVVYSGDYKKKKAAAHEAVKARLESRDIGIPTGFWESTYYKRAVYRMDENDPEMSEKKLQMEIDAYRLNDEKKLTGDARDVIYEGLKAQIVPEQQAHLDKMEELPKKLMSVSDEELLTLQGEILEYEMPGMHLSDILKVQNSKKVSIKSLFPQSKEEERRRTDQNSLISYYRKRIDLLNAYRAADAGVPIKHEDLGENTKNILRPCAGPDGFLDLERVKTTISPLLESNTNTIKTISDRLKKNKYKDTDDGGDQ